MHLNQNILQFINTHSQDEFDPYYVYDMMQIREHCRLFQAISYQHKAIHFASMANINKQFLQIVRDEKVNIFVNSILHLKAALEAGFSGKEIIFTASALSAKTMKYAGEAGIQMNIDSPGQLAQWQKLFPSKKIGIRCNIGDNVKPYSTHAGYFIGRESRLGFTLEEIQQISDKSIINGLHLYAGTDIFDIDYFINCYRELVKVAQLFPDLDYLNFGGGFGVSENGSEQFNMNLFSLRVTELMNVASQQQGKSLKLILEPGRIIGGEAGLFVCHVNDIKLRNGKQLAGVNASTVQFSRPLLYPEVARHPVTVIRKKNLISQQPVMPTLIYGCSTYSRDIFSNEKNLPLLWPGDIILFGNAGSYAASSHMQFLGFPKPDEYFI